MLSLSTIKFKRTITLDGQQIVDLTESVFKKTTVIKIVKTVTVTEEFEGRPAYLAKVVMGDESMFDLLYSVNGISNPLSVQAGQILLVPDKQSLNNAVTDLNADSNVQNNKAMQLLNSKYNPKFNNTDPARTAMLTGKNVSLRTPNMTPPNTVPVVVDGQGAIILGTNTTTTRCKSNLTDAQTRTEIIRNAVRTNLMASAISMVAATKNSVTLSLQSGGTVISKQTAVQAAISSTKSSSASPIG